MEWKDLYGLKYYLLYVLLVVSFFVYSGLTGWKWFNPTKTEPTRPVRSGSHSYFMRYHK